MALISTTSTDADGIPSGEFVSDAFTGVNLRASHTIMVRVKHGSTATNYHSVLAGYIAQADVTGSYIGRDSGGTSTGLDWTRQAAWPYARDEATISTCYGNTSTWYHVALVYDAGTGQKRAYINGAYISQQASSTTRTSSTTSVQFVVGAHNGKFADAALFDRALSDSEVQDMADYRVPQVTSGLRIFWRLDSDATDTSGNGLNGVESGGSPAVSWSTADNPPQPEVPTINITASASASTSGTASIQRILALGACTGATSTSGAATVGMTNTVAVAGGRGVGWADVMPRNGAEGYRFPTPGLSVSDSANGPATGGVTQRTFMAWMRYYNDTSISNAGLNAGFLWFRGTGGTGWAIIIAPFSSSGAGASCAGQLYIGGAAQVNLTISLDSEWHHFCATYDGTNFKFYSDGVQVGADFASSVPADDTATSVALSVNAGGYTPVDAAHVKAWVGRALNTTEIAAEMASYRPVTDTANVRGYWPMAWDNPRWDAWSGVMTLNAAIEHAGDDAPNGPPGSWPPIGSCAGSTSTSGTAQLNLVLSTGACTGATQTSGTAAVSATAAVAATGATSTSGTAQLNRVYDFASSASAQTTGAVASAWNYAQTASGSSTTSGATAVSSAAALASTASTTTQGDAAVDIAYSMAVTGSASTTGTAALTAAAAIAATGAAQTSGSIAAITLSVAAAGSTQTSGSATVTAAAALVAVGETSTVGASNTAGTLPCFASTSTSGATSFDTALFPVTALGSSTTSGTAAVDAGLPQSADGATSTSGTATVTASAVLVASGSTTTAGTSYFATRATANTQTAGAAVVSLFAPLAAFGSSSTTGAAALGLGIFPAGNTQTSGAATLSAGAALAAAGACSTFGNAVFDGVGPAPGGGAGGDTTYLRRMSAVGAGRRRVR